MIQKNSEEKRNTLWRAVMSVSSVLIVIIAVFFIIRLFTGNPIEGTWVSEDSGVTLEIGGDGKATVTGTDENGEEFSVTADFTVDKDIKTFTIYDDGTELSREVTDESESAADGTGIFVDAESLAGTYDYSVEQDRLTLTEREYGDWMVFERR
ncbi:hypothetical protein B5F07_04365 [Lachnoclostridium sp. An169]|uniref:hypothetical protein n=1 Tax=Lachnoclostridium sp. An169 TaxID=1965569 RepID=UPI000B36ED35|nr:hypothetical protein [Lachnoclostridium sp. An169]OUP85388.1 hypothetical protein B5F07_04365 [Lachnoclostridium sp. An169]